MGKVTAISDVFIGRNVWGKIANLQFDDELPDIHHGDVHIDILIT